MEVNKTLLDMIEANMLCPHPVAGESNLYTDLGFDSLSFTRLLVQIESAFSINFSLTEMHRCFRVDTLMATVQKKLEAGGCGDA